MSDMDKTQSRGIGFFGALTLLFIALKLMGHIAWSWLWVLAPLWMPVTLGFALLLILALAAVFWGDG